MAKVKINKQFLIKAMSKEVAPSLKYGLQKIESLTACAGFKGDIATIAAVQNFGNPANRMYNTPEGNPAPIPARNFMNVKESNGDVETTSMGKQKIQQFIQANIDKLLASIPKSGGAFYFAKRGGSIDPNTFAEKLADMMAEVIKGNISGGHLKPNTEATLSHKKGNKPLIDDGEMLNSVISWVEGTVKTYQRSDYA